MLLVNKEKGWLKKSELSTRKRRCKIKGPFLTMLLCWKKQSTASFFQDNSVSLGHLIGLRAGEKGRLYFPNSLRIEEREEKTLAKCSTSDDDGSKVKEEEMSRGICIPILLEALFKISKSKKSSTN